MMKVLPDYIVLNANIEEQIALQIDKNNYSNIQPSQTQEMFDTYNPVFLFFVKLYVYVGTKMLPFSPNVDCTDCKSHLDNVKS